MPLARRVDREVGVQHALFVGAAEVLQDAAELRLHRAVHPAVLARHPVDAPAHAHRERRAVEQVARAAADGPRLAVRELALERGQGLVQLVEAVRHLQPEVVQQVAPDHRYRGQQLLKGVHLRHVVHGAVDERLLGVGNGVDVSPQIRRLVLQWLVERQEHTGVGEVVHLSLPQPRDVGQLGGAEQELHLGVEVAAGNRLDLQVDVERLANRLVHRRLRVDRRRRVLRPHEGDGHPLGRGALLLAGTPHGAGNEQQGQACRNKHEPHGNSFCALPGARRV